MTVNGILEMYTTGIIYLNERVKNVVRIYN